METFFLQRFQSKSYTKIGDWFIFTSLKNVYFAFLTFGYAYLEAVDILYSMIADRIKAFSKFSFDQTICPPVEKNLCVFLHSKYVSFPLNLETLSRLKVSQCYCLHVVHKRQHTYYSVFFII